jgi:hypothetical protein
MKRKWERVFYILYHDASTMLRSNSALNALLSGRNFELSECIITQTIRVDKMKIFLNILGIVLILAGGTFFLQGTNVLPGSYMTGDPQWAINGGIMIVVGIGLIIWAARRK